MGLDLACWNHLLACYKCSSPDQLSKNFYGWHLAFAFLASSPGNFKSKGCVYVCVSEVMGCLDVMQRRDTCRLEETHEVH